MKRTTNQLNSPPHSVGRVTRTADRRIRGSVLIWSLPALVLVTAATVWWINSFQTTAGPGLPLVVAPPATARVISKPAPQSAVSKAVKEVSNVVVEPKSPEAPATAPPRVPQTAIGDKSPAQVKEILVGEWTGHYQGDRQLQVATDGTGKMVAHPEGLAATFLAAKLTFEIRWTLKGDQLEFETVGGDPLDKINVVVKMYGRRRAHKIVDLKSDQIMLLDEDGVTKYLWKRVAVDQSDVSKTTVPTTKVPTDC